MLQSARRAVLDVDIDFEEIARRLTSVCGSLAGALWGAGLAVFVDAVLVAPSRPPPTAYLPGAAATAALAVMGVAVPRHALADLDAAYDPATASAKRAALFAALVLAFGSVAGAVVVASGAPADLGRVGGGALGQTGLTLVAALLLWFRAPPDDGGFYSAY